MPLRYTEDPASLQSAKDIPEQYVIFYSSRDENGRMWCPVCRCLGAPDLCDPTILRPQQDCRDVEKIVEETFGKDDTWASLDPRLTSLSNGACWTGLLGRFLAPDTLPS